MLAYLVYHSGDGRWRVRPVLHCGKHKNTGLPLVQAPDWEGPRVVWGEGLFETSLEATAYASTKEDQRA